MVGLNVTHYSSISVFIALFLDLGMDLSRCAQIRGEYK